MKWLRFATDTGPRYGRLVGDNEIEPVNGTPFGDTVAAGDRFPLAGARLLAPIAPRRVFGVGLNYVNHIRETGSATPRIPMLFMKPESTVIGPDAAVIYPVEGKDVHYEAELAVVIGRRARNVAAADAYDHVAGYTVANDYVIRDYLENYYRPNLRAKNRDGLTAFGPWLVDAADVPDPMNLTLRTLVNGRITQEGNTRDMVFGIPALIAWLSSFMTLAPGDVILTGTPEGVVDVKAGDEVVTEVEGVGRLMNTIVDDAAFHDGGVSEPGF